MKYDTILHHIALEYEKKEHAEIFFTKILMIPKMKSFTLSKELSSAIFGMQENIDVEMYNNGSILFEVFIVPAQKKQGYGHVCIEVADKTSFIARCTSFHLEPFFIQKDGKELLFVRDFSLNLYEVKEQQKI